MITPPRPAFSRSALVIAFALTAPFGALIGAGMASGSDSASMDACKELMTARKAMHEKVATEDTQLAAQVAAMNSASADKKAGLVATVVSTLVEQRTQRDALAAKAESTMMSHMMEHMAKGGDSMMACPMMTDSAMGAKDTMPKASPMPGANRKN